MQMSIIFSIFRLNFLLWGDIVKIRGDCVTTGQRIKAARKKAGMTQKELGEKLGLSFQSIAQWENDLRNPKYDTLQRIAAALGVEWTDLVPTSEQGKQVIEHIKEELQEVERAQTPKQRSPFKAGQTYFGGDMKVTNVTVRPDGKETITVDMNIGKLSADDIVGYLEMFEKMSKLGMSVDGVSKLIEAAANAANEISNATRPETTPQSPPASQEGKDTTPPPDAPETPPEGE